MNIDQRLSALELTHSFPTPSQVRSLWEGLWTPKAIELLNTCREIVCLGEEVSAVMTEGYDEFDVDRVIAKMKKQGWSVTHRTHGRCALIIAPQTRTVQRDD